MNATDPTSTSGPFPAPPDDGELIRYLDGELSAAGARAVEEAAASDAGVRTRLERLRALGAEASTMLEAVEVPAVPPRRVAPGDADGRDKRGAPGSAWRRAAVLVLLGGTLGGAVAAAAVPGVAERLAAGIRSVAAWVDGSPPGQAPREGTGHGTTRVAFPVSGTVFTVTFEGPLDGGYLTVGRSPGADAVARVEGGDPALQVDPDGLRVGGWEADMELEVRVPQAVETLRLRVDGALDRTVSLAALEGGTLRLPLAPESRP